MTEAWWRLDADAVYATLGTGRSGLGAGEAAARLTRFGPNRVRPPERARSLPILLHQLKSPLGRLHSPGSEQGVCHALEPGEAAAVSD